MGNSAGYSGMAAEFSPRFGNSARFAAMDVGTGGCAADRRRMPELVNRPTLARSLRRPRCVVWRGRGCKPGGRARVRTLVEMLLDAAPHEHVMRRLGQACRLRLGWSTRWTQRIAVRLIGDLVEIRRTLNEHEREKHLRIQTAHRAALGGARHAVEIRATARPPKPAYSFVHNRSTAPRLWDPSSRFLRGFRPQADVPSQRPHRCWHFASESALAIESARRGSSWYSARAQPPLHQLRRARPSPPSPRAKPAAWQCDRGTRVEVQAIQTSIRLLVMKANASCMPDRA
jgi:hypothetical protein